MEEKRYEEMSNVELMGVIAEKDSVIDGLVDKLNNGSLSLPEQQGVADSQTHDDV